MQRWFDTRDEDDIGILEQIRFKAPHVTSYSDIIAYRIKNVTAL